MSAIDLPIHPQPRATIVDTSSSAVTIESVRLALGAASLRQAVTASNIANASSPDHVRMRVAFEEELSSALAEAGHDPAQALAALGGVQPQVLPAEHAGPVSLDQEMVELSSNTLRYQALSRGLARYLSVAAAIASGAKG